MVGLLYEPYENWGLGFQRGKCRDGQDVLLLVRASYYGVQGLGFKLSDSSIELQARFSFRKQSSCDHMCRLFSPASEFFNLLGFRV